MEKLYFYIKVALIFLLIILIPLLFGLGLEKFFLDFFDYQIPGSWLPGIVVVLIGFILFYYDIKNKDNSIKRCIITRRLFEEYFQEAIKKVKDEEDKENAIMEFENLLEDSFEEELERKINEEDKYL